MRRERQKRIPVHREGVNRELIARLTLALVSLVRSERTRHAQSHSRSRFLSLQTVPPPGSRQPASRKKTRARSYEFALRIKARDERARRLEEAGGAFVRRAERDARKTVLVALLVLTNDPLLLCSARPRTFRRLCLATNTSLSLLAPYSRPFLPKRAYAARLHSPLSSYIHTTNVAPIAWESSMFPIPKRSPGVPTDRRKSRRETGRSYRSERARARASVRAAVTNSAPDMGSIEPGVSRRLTKI